MIKFDPTSVQVFAADNSDVLKAIREMIAAELKHTQVVVGSSEKQAGAQRKMYEQMSLLTAATGGQTSALGKLAFGAKALVGGFGGMGIALMGVGTVMREVSPMVDRLIGGLSDIIMYGTTERWTPLADNIALITAHMAKAAAMAERWRAEFELLTPSQQASSTADRAAENRTAAALAEADARGKLASAYDILTQAQSRQALELAKSQAGRAEGRTSQGSLQLRHEAEAAAAQAVALAQGEYNIAVTEASTAMEQHRTAIAGVTKAERDLEAAVSASLPPMEITTAKMTAQQVAATKLAMALANHLAPSYELLAAEQRKTPQLQALGAGSGVDIGITSPQFGLGGPLAGIAPPNAMPKLVRDTELATTAMDVFRDSAMSAFAILTDGTKSLGDAMDAFFGRLFTGLAMELYTIAIKAALQYNLAKAALAFGGAAIATGFARQFGGNGAPGGGGSGSGAYAGASSGPKTTYTTILVGDSFTGSSPRQNASKLKRYLRMGEERTS